MQISLKSVSLNLIIPYSFLIIEYEIYLPCNSYHVMHSILIDKKKYKSKEKLYF